ncbi:hypothetical protein DKK70_05010 [Gilliamella apicola]|uniref:Uncharacterized protein n=1 Tax=Gilliamella apicola TaxID=1196095 RepID=A0A2V4E8F8_9GAMM|nr:hypothetical protein [Gilliamella apicola]PXZ07216.1 hypothetical protein DKK70_05010 [Gilliamella apicola]
MQPKNIEKKICAEAEKIKASLDIAYQKRQDILVDILNLKNEQASIYQKIATIYLKESPHNDNFQIQNIIKQLQGLSSDLTSKVSHLDKVIAQFQQELQDIHAKIDELTTQKVLQLESDPEYVALCNLFTNEKGFLEKITKDYELCQEEFTKKLAEYSKNCYYNYLRKRNYGEDNYKGRWIFRNLDETIAGFIHFNENYNNQKILESLIKESQIKYENQQKSYELAIDQKFDKEQLVEKSLNLPQLKSQLVNIEYDLEDAQRQRKKAYDSLNGTQTGQSDQFKRLSTQLAKLLENQSIKQLEWLTSQTESKEDDFLLKRIPEIDDQINQLEERIPHVQESINNQEKIYIRFNQTLKLFRQNNVPSSFYEYNISSYTLDDLLESLKNHGYSPEKIVMELLTCRVLKNNTTSTNTKTKSVWSVLCSLSSSSNYSSRSSSSDRYSSSSSSSSDRYSSSSSSNSDRYSSSSSSSSDRYSSSSSSSSNGYSSSSSSSSNGYSSSSSSSSNGFSSSSSSGGGGYRTTDSF